MTVPVPHPTPPSPPSAPPSLPITFAGNFYPATAVDMYWDASAQRRRRLTPQQRRDCATLLGLIAMAIVVEHYGATESLIWATGAAASRGAHAGRLGGGWGMVIGAGIGALIAIATYRASVDSRVAQFCRDNM